MDILTQILILNPNKDVAVIELLIEKTKAEVVLITKRDYVSQMDNVVSDMVIWKLNTLGTDGITAQSYNGISESYLDNYPISIRKQLSALTKRVFFL